MGPVRARTSSMSTRQKAIAGAFVLLLILIIWQGAGLFRNSTPTVATTATPQPTSSMAATNPTISGGANSPTQVVAAPAPAVIQPKPVPVTKDIELLKLQQETQAKYIATLNELQMLKLQREIVETNQAIMQAKLATVKAEKTINDVLTPPAPPPPPAVPQGAYAAQLGGPPPSAQPAAPMVDPGYVVISVSYQLGHWTAVLGNQGKLFNVSRGDVMPIDGSMVVNIDKNGVILRKEGKQRRISLINAI